MFKLREGIEVGLRLPNSAAYKAVVDRFEKAPETETEKRRFRAIMLIKVAAGNLYGVELSSVKIHEARSLLAEALTADEIEIIMKRSEVAP